MNCPHLSPYPFLPHFCRVLLFYLIFFLIFLNNFIWSSSVKSEVFFSQLRSLNQLGVPFVFFVKSYLSGEIGACKSLEQQPDSSTCRSSGGKFVSCMLKVLLLISILYNMHINTKILQLPCNLLSGLLLTQMFTKQNLTHAYN